MKLRVAIIQLNSILRQPTQNITKIHNLISSKPNFKNVDLIVLPEMSITGYYFKSSQDITPYLESTNSFGPSLNFARDLSRKYNCFTVIGYPESDNSKIYNSCATFNRTGKLIHNYRKTFLYETDEVWGCEENPNKGFPATKLKFKDDEEDVIVNFGICMDLNPYKFEAPFHAFEFGSSCLNQKARLIICPMNWLTNESPSLHKEIQETKRCEMAKELEAKMKLDNSPNVTNLNYWILRFYPYLQDELTWLKDDDKVHVLIANRVGVEDDIVYGGSSCTLKFNDGENYLSSVLGQCKEDILIHDIDV
ncbi:unnamed protein product [Candida verbasci]|uniref:CN hydrolase domain-containing protein n=1 Tax=Candida verbasci TaxID=1227364 RepID=A0A9W4TR00_9ASCO|nr:unnamed protein product [Candida verbasci]